MFIFEDAPLEAQKIHEQIENWKPENPKKDWLEDLMYSHLAAIDGKTQSTMQASSMLLLFSAVSGYFQEILSETSSAVKTIKIITTFGFSLAGVLFFISVFMCISVVSLYWIPAEYRKAPNGDKKFALKLVWIRNRRTRRYRIAWLFAMLGLSIIALTVVISTVYLLSDNFCNCS